ncbi:MAG: acyl-CoA thioesterase [Phycisphaera sp.]|nr:acyl-CoA thioesterase [Phycisphaera sp.]
MTRDRLDPIAPHELPPLHASLGAPAPESATPVFAVRIEVLPDETSALVPHANNIVILGWVDLAASLHGAHAGAAREEIARDGRMWFVARHEIDYLAEAFAGEPLVLATWVERAGRTSLLRATAIVRTDGTPIARARSRWAFVDLGTRRPTAIPAEVLARLTGGASGDGQSAKKNPVRSEV